MPLPDWFYVIYQFASTRTGIPAKQIQRELGVSYPTALRMCNSIRKAMMEERYVETTCEIDETYMGNKRRWHTKRGRGTSTKQPVFGIMEKGGVVVAKVVENTKRDTLMPIIEETVAKDTEVHTDEYNVYNTLAEKGYEHDTVKHKGRPIREVPGGWNDLPPSSQRRLLELPKKRHQRRTPWGVR